MDSGKAYDMGIYAGDFETTTNPDDCRVWAWCICDIYNIDETIELVGLKDRMFNFPSQLSGGEQQRVAIARALAKNPKLLLCDEPTGALDYQTGKQVLKVLQDTCRTQNKTVIVITHNLALTPMGDKVIKVRSGKIESITCNEHPMDVNDIEY